MRYKYVKKLTEVASQAFAENAVSPPKPRSLPVQYSPAEKIPQTDRRIHWYFYTEEPSESEESDSSSSWHYDSQKLWWSASLLQESRGIMSRNRTLLASCMVLAGYVVSHLPAIGHLQLGIHEQD
ncbi:hypothetical protein BaRGS_00034266, partial [Batillaria attramentaria]